MNVKNLLATVMNQRQAAQGQGGADMASGSRIAGALLVAFEG